MSINVPNLSLPATDGKNINLKDYAGKYIVLYFYPKDNTPGCSTEGKDFRITTLNFKNTMLKFLVCHAIKSLHMTNSNVN